MKTVAILTTLLLPNASAFMQKPAFRHSILVQEKINSKIELDSPKVVNTDELAAGEKKVYCRCWKSGTFPLCDAAHVEHNKETGDNVGPLIVSCAKGD